MTCCITGPAKATTPRSAHLLSTEGRNLLLERAELAVWPLHHAVFAAQFLERCSAHAELFGNLIERHVEVVAQLLLREHLRLI